MSTNSVRFFPSLRSASKSTLSDGPIILQVMSSVRPTRPTPRKHSVTTAPPLLLGATVRLRGRDATGVIIANSIDPDRVRVRWDDDGDVTLCLRAKLQPVR
jgi:hypothetical protein